MNPIKIISDSSCDLPNSIKNKFSIDIVPFYVSLNHKDYMKEVEELSVENFTKELVVHKIFPKTSFPPVFDYISKFKAYLNAGFDIICVCLSEKFSGSYQSAFNAAQILSTEYPNNKIFVVDSILATGAQGLLINQCALMRDAGLEIEKIVNKLEIIKKTGMIYFTIDALDYLQNGGRIGKVGALAGQILNIKPIIGFSNGELVPQNKVRGNKKAIKEIIDLTIKAVGQNPQDYSYSFVTSNRFDEIEDVQATLFNEYKITITDINIIGATIGSHVGPTVLGICFIKKYTAV